MENDPIFHNQDSFWAVLATWLLTRENANTPTGQRRVMPLDKVLLRYADFFKFIYRLTPKGFLAQHLQNLVLEWTNRKLKELRTLERAGLVESGYFEFKDKA